jgi:hypothetical protein
VGRTALIVLTLTLLIGSAAAFTRTEKLKLEPAPIGRPKFEKYMSPGCGCRHESSSLSFLLRHAERLDVAVVDADGSYVATVARGKDLGPGRVAFRWDGRDSDGRVVPDGAYRLRVRLGHDRRTILIPKTIVVDTRAPNVDLVGANQDGGLFVRYRLDEAARVLVLVDRKVVARGKRHRPGTWSLRWDDVMSLPPSAPRELSLVAVDRAGNRSEPTTPVAFSAR